MRSRRYRWETRPGAPLGPKAHRAPRQIQMQAHLREALTKRLKLHSLRLDDERRTLGNAGQQHNPLVQHLVVLEIVQSAMGAVLWCAAK